MKAEKNSIEKQKKYIRYYVPNPDKKSQLDVPISHEEYLAAHFKSSSGTAGNMKGRVLFKAVHGIYTDEVDLERTYLLLEDRDEEEARERRKRKKDEKDEDDKGCCGAWYCCPFRCLWKIFCCFFG